jgi:predicted alpha/beta-fold hydrolase
LILTAANDPFVPVEPFTSDVVRANPSVTVVITRDGGHCAFVEAAGEDYDGYWAEREIVRFAQAQFVNSAL